MDAQAGQTSDALELYGKAIDADSDFLDARLNRGSLLLDGGQLDAGIQDERQALKIQPLSAEARFNLAVGLLKQGKEDDALQQLAITVKYRSDYLPAHVQYGLLLYQTGRSEEAIEQFREVLRVDPENTAARSALLQIGAGDVD